MNRILFLWLTLFPLLVGTAVAQEGMPYFTKDFPPEEFAARRQHVAKAIGPEAVALIQGAASPAGFQRFRQNNEFYYLCGVEVPHAYLLINGGTGRTTLYLPHRDEGRERVEGRLFSAGDDSLVRRVTGVDAVLPVDMLSQSLARMARSTTPPRLYVPHQPPEGANTSRDMALRHQADVAADPWDGGLDRSQRFRELLRRRFPMLPIADLSPILDSLRLIKSPREIEMLRKATQLSGLALMEAMRSTKPGIYEYELDAVAKYIFFRNGAQGEAYYSLVAGGRNAWYPHYHAGRKRLRDGELVLMDYAPDFGYYVADVTRMWPVNGRFNRWQRELYGFYLACYRAILEEIRPGDTAQAVKQRAVTKMRVALQAATFSRPAYRRAAERYVADYARGAENPNTTLGHWVGMAAHDVGPRDPVLRPGMVFTIEPALRVPEEQIYIRLEDMIVITDKGVEVLSGFVPMDMEAIERLMQEEGLLQLRGRDTVFREYAPSGAK